MKLSDLLVTPLVLCVSLVLSNDELPTLFRNESIALFDFSGGSQTSFSLIEAGTRVHGQQPLEDLGLSKRQQTTCVNTGYVCVLTHLTKQYPAPNIATKCCPPSYDCFPSRCCPTGYRPCGSSNCYDPSISQCCADSGTVCRLGYDCNGDGTCCPSGQQRCGNSRCYNPASQKCCADGTVCRLGYNCNGDGTCCPSGQQPCGNSKCYDPTSQKCCTAPGYAWGCDTDEECCMEGGATACYNPSSEQCCPGGSCSKSRTCCGNECCGADYTCGSDGYCTAKPSPPPPSKPPPETASGAPTTTTRTITFRYDPDRKVPAKNGELYEATNKAVLENMCEGIKAYLGSVSQSVELTRADPSTRKTNRKTMCPPDYCATALKEYLARYYPAGIPLEAQEAITMAQDMSCDEFPFAISAEGGNTAKGVRFCIPSAENSWQGGVMGNFFREATGIGVGETFTVTIEGFDCKTMMPELGFSAVRRRDGRVGSESIWRSYDKSDPTQNLITLPLGNLDAGSHEVDLNVSVGSGNPTFTVVTYDGRQIGADVAPSGKITFNLEEDEDAVGVVGVTTQDVGVDLTYRSVNVTESNGAVMGRGVGFGVVSLGVLAFVGYGVFVL